MLKFVTSSGQLNGEWVGKYHTHSIGHAEVHLAFFQLDFESFKRSPRGHKAEELLGPGQEVVVGIFQTTTGAIGTIQLQIEGDSFEGTALQVTPGCTAQYVMKGTVNGNTMDWSFQGSDCLGNEDGSGTAERVWPAAGQ